MKHILHKLAGRTRRPRRQPRRAVAAPPRTAEVLEARELLAADVLVNFRFEVTDLAGEAIAEVDVGETFVLEAWVQDLRDLPEGEGGVLSGYLDLFYDTLKLDVVHDSIADGPLFGLAPGGDTSVDGLVDNIGSTLSNPFERPGTEELLLFTIEFTATAPGLALFTSEASGDPVYVTSIYDLMRELAPDEIAYDTASIEIFQFAAVDDSFLDIEEDTTRMLDVLANDTPGKSSGSLAISEVSGVPSGHQVQIVGDQLQFMPAAGFVGNVTFDYVLTDGDQTDIATVTIEVNAAPKASVDAFVWLDESGNGIYEFGEPFVADVTVELFNAGADGRLGGSDDTLVGTTTTDSEGNYVFSELPPGLYYLQFSGLPSGHGFTLQHQGVEPTLDSDVDPGTGRTDVFELVADELRRSLDAGLVDTLPPLAAQFDATIVRAATATDAAGQVKALADSEAWVHEWNTFWVEIWVSTPDAVNFGVQTAEISLDYETDYFTATSVQAGTAFSNANFSFNINDAAGSVEVAGEYEGGGQVGADQFVLLARIEFKPLAGDSGVAISLGDPQYPQPVAPGWLQLAAGSAAATLDSPGPLDVRLGDAPATKLMPVIYDLNDDGLVGFSDFSIFTASFLKDVGDSPQTYKADFNGDGRVNYGDFNFLATNFLASRSSGDALIFSPNFPDAWLADPLLLAVENGPEPPAVAPESLEQHELQAAVDVAIDAWAAAGYQAAQSLRGNLSLQVVDLPGTMLARANGHVLQLDATAAGYGWFTDVSPASHEAFYTAGQAWLALPGGAASGRVDLLTVVLHEIGHLMGLEHEHELAVMRETLALGTRRLPPQPDLDELAADAYFASLGN